MVKVRGMSELTPYLCVADARAAIDWYVDVLGATVTYEPVVMPDGRVGHVARCSGTRSVTAGSSTPPNLAS